eukprot:1913778-Rhodomonas_salina.3
MTLGYTLVRMERPSKTACTLTSTTCDFVSTPLGTDGTRKSASGVVPTWIVASFGAKAGRLLKATVTMSPPEASPDEG